MTRGWIYQASGGIACLCYPSAAVATSTVRQRTQ